MGRALAEDAGTAHPHAAARRSLAEEKEVLGDALGAFARRLAPAGNPPTTGAGAEAWPVLLTVLDRLFGSGVHPLGRPRFVTEGLLELLRAEAREQRPASSGSRRPGPGAAGHALASLAVSGQLRGAVSGALGRSVAPTYDAVYQYDPPGSHVRTHVDTRGYELVVHLVLEHGLPRREGRAESALVVHLPGRREPLRVPLGVGEAVVLHGRGTVHSWEPLADDEDRTMIAVGFASLP
jgi:hypothetical protein